MIGEVNLDGVYVSSALVAACFAGLFLLVLRRAFLWSGFYRLVWHHRLVDLAIFTILWAAAARVLPVLADIVGRYL
ncbi:MULTISPECIES: DUF1656 domain-containing protein [unclassified Rhizobium]|jgi:hypothetical protein|uniref:DUF1656 domain-containing protein n=1 Tax=unclassified Rhizobium TaxID=2613769 RepID=UPI0006491225|nr:MULTISPECIES: DUF1656 domain-containing protein [unclassified Rhizobium]OJY74124.1 MAG: hypothetical protein BGP09_27410 [Rhizobium sp. 60-20]RKD61443.1 uncharacterized protein DUF1656 [Rhizobium sp. WW_1]